MVRLRHAMGHRGRDGIFQFQLPDLAVAAEDWRVQCLATK